jgi:hypothetical protein
MPGQATAGDIVATYPDLEHARAAITALERGGIEGGDIALDGRADAETAVPADPADPDMSVATDIAKFSILWGAIGTAGGALFGALIAFLLFGTDATALWAAIIAMALVGASIGGVLGPTVMIGQSPSWERTYQHNDQTGRVLLSVRAVNHKEAEQAESILRSTGPLRIERRGRVRPST